ncbi:hypothetical protein BJP27_24435 (plasmid) [Pseudomonas oryzihabitans]|nr:hypothetical protein BJP27_24435 [Pseudomonas psychrotolerans]
MNLRILKKLSKRAAPHLAALGDARKQFRAEPGDNYTHTIGFERKHWDRSTIPDFTGWKDDIEYRTRKGDAVVHLSEKYIHPWAGTVMVGAMEGYYEPEWHECTAWDSLKDLVRDHYMDVDLDQVLEAECGEGECPWVCLRRLPTTRDVLAALPDVLAGLARQKLAREAAA